MKKFFTRKLAVWTGIAAMALSVGCSEYDDTDLWNNVNDLKDRVAALETQLKRMNEDISSVKKIVDALQKNVYVAKVEQTDNGYIIYFTDNSTATIVNGSDGQPGKDAPVIGVKQDTDGVYYWTITVGDRTDWLTGPDGGKLRVTGRDGEDGQTVTPVISVDTEGYWTISFDGGKTHERILDASGNPVLAVGESGSGIGSLFRSVTEDDENVYFTLSDGTVITVAKRSSFYLLIRKAPEVAPFVYGETQTFEVESVGVEKVVVTKPDGWRASYAENLLTVTAPAEEHADYCELEGEVSLIYFSSNNQSAVVSMNVTVDKDHTGTTGNEDFSVSITEITDKSVSADIMPENVAMTYYATVYDAAKYDAAGEAAFITEQLAMFNYYIQYMPAYLEMYLHTGAFTYQNTQLKPESKLYLAIFGIDADYDGQVCTASTKVFTAPFTTKHQVIINTVYRIDVTDVTWCGARYTTAPSDDLGYFHGFVKKSDFEKHSTEAEFMESVIADWRSEYFDELYGPDATLTWADLTVNGPKTVVAPGLAARALLDDTDYYVYAFGCTDGNSTSPLSIEGFKTPKFVPAAQCSFDITTSVERQDVTVKVVPSDKNLTYYWSIYERSYYNEFGTDVQYAADDLFWLQQSLGQDGGKLEDQLLTGEDTYTVRDLKAATGYVICAYGLTSEGRITTVPTVAEVVTKGTIDTGSATPKLYSAGAHRTVKPLR